MNKIERLIAIVMILLQKNVVSATEFAQLFNVSKRTILRDMETLGLSNIPIYSINGVHGGYGIMDEYKLDKRLLSSKDLENILTALGGLGQVMFSDEVELTLKKIESMIGSATSRGSIQLSFYNWDGRSEIAQILKTCQEAIMQGRLLTFDYIDGSGVRTTRMVEPYQLHFSEMSWYLKGYCLSRMEYRTFKLSRTDHLNIDSKSFVARDFMAEQQTEQHYQPELTAIKVLISHRIKDHFIERYGQKKIEAYNSDFLIAQIDVPQNDFGFKFLVSFGTDLEILEPQAYVEDFRTFLHAMIKKYV
ncbi:helix-turn-helix transcriptional regulator [Paenibacillus radicis (ex Gao et al. 2016)]|uniref:Transcriptional regulator n=1 Tax=Paenibacillus radicis (ex Gao et al. 2016) TaxID=1737354 RepID=A0A917H4Z4_9BACL|nr:YafY family protein [Paenibacillus radicis (ex Gao et al. 2016)]GGG68137.1 transcriptional regulator [Paenibacillus radicis (ex Gao et al. 2016)]